MAVVGGALVFIPCVLLVLGSWVGVLRLVVGGSLLVVSVRRWRVAFSGWWLPLGDWRVVTGGWW